MTPAEKQLAPAPDAPAMRASSNQIPDSRVSRPMTMEGGCPEPGDKYLARDDPMISAVGESSGNFPASPRMPSVPKSAVMYVCSNVLSFVLCSLLFPVQSTKHKAHLFALREFTWID